MSGKQVITTLAHKVALAVICTIVSVAFTPAVLWVVKVALVFVGVRHPLDGVDLRNSTVNHSRSINK